MSTFVDDSVDITNIAKTTKIVKIDSLDKKWPLLINSATSDPNLPIYILVYTRK